MMVRCYIAKLIEAIAGDHESHIVLRLVISIIGGICRIVISEIMMATMEENEVEMMMIDGLLVRDPL